MAISIGYNSLTRSANIKKKRLEKKNKADIKITNVADNLKSVQALIREEIKRAQQSKKDKKINLKKGSRRAGPPKTPKNLKNNAKNRALKVQKKGPQTNARKVGPSARKQQSKR